MDSTDLKQWRPMATAPKDGTRIIVLTRATEQGPSDVDVVRWTKPPNLGDYCWTATDSDHSCTIIYDNWEVAYWMPMPSGMAPYKTPHLASKLPPPPEEEDGSGI
ncbi:MAG: hypothetical protein ACLPID_21705 [Beijerinckiaceae bacterium]